jgi:hypothetical protein
LGTSLPLRSIEAEKPDTGNGSPRTAKGVRSALIGIGSFLVLVALLLTGPVSASLASEHTEITGEYGKEGPKSSGLAGCRIAWDSGAEHLLDFGEGKIFGLAVSPGSATPIGGNFPISTEIGTSCGEPDMDVDSGTGNIYAVQSGGEGQIFGWDRNGEKLPSFPVQIAPPREICGVDVGPGGGPWGGNYSGGGSVVKFKPDGTADGTIPIGTSFCKLAVNRANGDVFIQPYSGGEIFKLSASSGYTTKTNFPAPGSNEPGMAVNGAEEKLYVTSGNTIKAYNTETAALIETVTLPETASGGVAVDEGTDTLFATVGFGESGYIVEYLGLTTPKATTGEPTANSEVSGTADPNGVGPITECYFEYGTSTSYEIEPNVKGEQPCTESTPFNSVQTVHAVLPNLTGEQTYHYRLVLSNGEPHVIGKGGDKTIVPHNVKGLVTKPATEITHDSATLNAEFEGTNEDTHYYFEWGQTTYFGHKTATPPGDDAGVTTGPTAVSTPISNLESGITYHFRVVAQNDIGVSIVADKTFTTTGPPSIDSATTSHLTANSADVDLTINPHGFETEYFVEYGVTTDYGQIAPVPNGVLAAATTAQEVTVPLTGLNGGLYHFRVTASSQEGTVETEDQSFTFKPHECPNSQVRQQNESQYLPDCRSYELVSPEITGNIELSNARDTPNTFASDPPRFAYTGGVGGIKGTEPVNSAGPDTYIATRSPSGWKSTLVGFRGFETQGGGDLFANPELTKFLSWNENAAFEGEPQPPHKVPYIFGMQGGNPIERWPTNFESLANAEENKGAVQPSKSLEHLALTSTNVEWAPGGQIGGVGSAYDYNAATETMTLISLDEQGNPIQRPAGDTSESPLGIFFPIAVNGEEPYVLFTTPSPREKPFYEHAVPSNSPVSDDGTHILMATSSTAYETFTRPRPPVRLYMSVDNGGTYEHFEVSKEKFVTYVGMTRDGSEVYFTSPEQLTSEDTDTSIDLYGWSEGTNELTLLSKGAPGAEGTGNSDNCTVNYVAKCGIVPVITKGSGDSSFSQGGEVYFFSPEVLDGSKGVANRENLYVYRNGAPLFVGSFDPTPQSEQATGPISRIEVSPNGEHVGLITKTRLTGYDNAGKEEMYDYDPTVKRLICVSCRPDGKAPKFNVEGSKNGLFISDDGRIFFSTEEPLVPTDTNEALDVYEYSEGRPQLITTGSGTSEAGEGSYGGKYSAPTAAGLVGVSANGIDVYFATRDVLVPQNHNGPFLAFYDARSNGGFPFLPPLAPCEAADECHGEGNVLPVHPGVASETDLGARGNAPNPAAKKHKKSKKHKKHKSKKHKRYLKSRHAGHHSQGGN